MKFSNAQLAKVGFKSLQGEPEARERRGGPVEVGGEVEQLRALVAQLQEELAVEREKRMRLAAIVRPLVERARQAAQVPQGRAYNTADLGAPPPPPARQQGPRTPEVLPPEDRPPRERKFAPAKGKKDPLRAIIQEDEDDADDDIEEMLDG